MGLFSGSPTFLAETELHGEISKIILEAKSQLLIVSPYIEPGETFIRELERKAKRFAEADAETNEPQAGVGLYFRAEKLAEYRSEAWFKRLDSAGVFLGVIERLHSKLYVNDAKALVTSVNFTAGSWVNSYDVGVLVPAGSAMCEQIEAYLDKLDEDVRPVNGASQARQVRAGPKKRGTRAAGAARQGFCLGCGKPHAFDLARPMHFPCYQAKQPERFCHQCGARASVTVKAPRCESCFRR